MVILKHLQVKSQTSSYLGQPPTRKEATLPISLGGLGLRLASTSAPAAYIGSLNSTNVVVSLLLDLDTCTHFNPPENELSLRFNLKACFPDMDINSASQKSLQRAVDTDTLLNCWESASLRDKARLNTYVAWLSSFSQSPPTRFVVSVVISLTILVTMVLSGSNATTPFVTSSGILYCKITRVQSRSNNVVITTTGQATFSTPTSGLVSLHTLM